VPAFAVVLAGVNATDALVMSQVVLSIALPVPMLALLWLTAQRSVMGDFVSGMKVRIAAGGGALVVLCLNFVLLAQAFGVPIPFLQA